MSADLLLVALMGGALAFTAWMWVPPRRGSGLEPSTQAGSAQLDEPPRRIEPFVEASPTFADLVTIGSLEQRPSIEVEVEDADPVDDDPTPDQSVEDDGDDDSDRHLSPRERANEKRAAEFRASRYGLVRLDGGVKRVGVEPERMDTWPPAAVEEE